MSKRLRVLMTAALMTLLSTPAFAGDVVIQLSPGDDLVIQDDGSSELWSVDEATGEVSRNGQLFLHSRGDIASLFLGRFTGWWNTGYANSAFGLQALFHNTSGDRNSAFGYLAMDANTTGRSNSAFGANALYSNTTGDSNSAFGRSALFNNSTGERNAAFGHQALSNNTVNDNSAFGHFALTGNTTGTTNSAFGAFALRSSTISHGNSAFGYSALLLNTGGNQNSAFGSGSLMNNGNGFGNSAFGYEALNDNTGNFNSAFGNGSLGNNTSGSSNAAFGLLSLAVNTSGTNNVGIGRYALNGNLAGDHNTAIGDSALKITNGNENIGIGSGAGINQTIGSDNIYIGNAGVAAESDKIRIGTEGTQDEAFMAGIVGNPVNSSTDEVVYVSPSGELRSGEVSSLRFKEAVRDMGDRSSSLMKLRPVTFRYKEAGTESAEAYGLIAEEVAEVAPELVRFDDGGRPHSVRYDLLPRMLLNEVQKQQRTIDEQREVIAALAGRLERLESRLGSDREGSNR